VSTATIRPATLADLPALYSVALKTGDSGNDATGMFRNDVLLGEVFVGPYVTFATETSFVLNKDNIASGYGLCVLDTLAFQHHCHQEWWPVLQDKYRSVSEEASRDWLLAEIFRPTPSPNEILEDYPSHGHIDLLPHLQGQGWGRTMMQTMESKLIELGSNGFHLRVSALNNRGLKFYAAIGYDELMRRGDEVIVGKRF
jgi:GNAT superfamily N-acetyltransferase